VQNRFHSPRNEMSNPRPRTNRPLTIPARYTVDREEVDRLRKRFMKLDKVRLPSSSKNQTDPNNPTLGPPTNKSTHRTAPAQSSAKNSCNSPKSPPTLWRHV
jgi:hypothetical protein